MKNLLSKRIQKKTPKIIILKTDIGIPLQYIYSLRKTFWNNSFSAFVVKLNKKTSWDFCKKPSWDFCYWRPRLILSLKSCVVRNFNFAVYHSREYLTMSISTETGSASYNCASHPQMDIKIPSNCYQRCFIEYIKFPYTLFLL